MIAAFGCELDPDTGAETSSSALEAGSNPASTAETFHPSGVIDRANPFFQRLGSNERTCEQRDDLIAFLSAL